MYISGLLFKFQEPVFLAHPESELAAQAVWQCMVEDPRLLFRPLLNQFNKLYQDISDKKTATSQTKFLNTLVQQQLHGVAQELLYKTNESLSCTYMYVYNCM